ncbi:DUF2093 domain-containing protein [Pontixanthobacter aquaemixtae]|uniref:DUF2093 domain-containing protein n=1 Tax=Pontixanthobacter aquaemixtae TaxID=1958940 RepID=A0A844ZVH3_9SPHN|nr:DUF2093 domain-containing protein [Pontixanthobacter aquaemixtae]MXO91474.1 DUF2093 domain-containing protein [Pontixanthobacter aquaemixtae]
MLMSSGEKEAKLAYGPNGFRVVKSGSFVLCAVTSEQIGLEELRYWSVDLQEPYASAEIATRRLMDIE